MRSLASEEFFTVDEVAARLRVNPQTVRNWMSEGTLPFVRVGRRVRILRSDFENTLDAGYRGRGTRPAASHPEESFGQAFWDGDYVPRAATRDDTGQGFLG